jgi:hypothetical protein
MIFRNRQKHLSRAYARQLIVCITSVALASIPVTASAVSVFTGGVGGISFGVANIGAPVGTGTPTYLPNNNFPGRSDILLNPGIGQSAYATVANNTSSTGSIPFGPGQYVYNTQIGGGNVNGPFGSGSAAIGGGLFGYSLADGGIPGGTSASYEIMTWTANFTQVGAALPLTTGTFITAGGFLPENQDLALVSLRTKLTGSTLGAIEVPGLILAVERGAGNSYNYLALQDNNNGGLGATAMPGGWAVKIDDIVTGKFRAMAYNTFPFAIPNGELLTAQITATVFADPAHFDMFDPLAFENNDILFDAIANGGNGIINPFPVTPLLNQQDPANAVPEPAAVSLLLIAAFACWPRGRHSS